MKVEKGIKVSKLKSGRDLKYPFDDMEVGDSFYSEENAASIRNASYAYGKRHGMTFSSRKEKDGIRCWRTK